MKKLLLIIALFLIPSVCFGAIAATTIWEIQQTATAGNINGCGYDSALSGTDYTQQTTAQLALTDWASSDTTGGGSCGTGTCGASTYCVSTATGGITAAMLGNILHLTAGTGVTVGWYEIMTRPDTSGNYVCLDRASTASSYTAGTGKVGGACSMNSTLDNDFLEVLVPGNIVYIKYNASTIGIGEGISIGTSNGTAALPIWLVGYNTTRTITNSDASRPTLNVASNSWTGGNYWIHKNLIFTVTSTTGIALGSSCSLNRCKITNSGTTAGSYGVYTGSYNRIVNCEITSTKGVPVRLTNMSKLLNSYVHGGANSTSCVELASDDTFVAFNIIAGCPTTGIIINSTKDRATIIQNTIYGNETPAGIAIDGNDSENTIIWGNIIYGWSTGILFDAEAKINLIDYNNIYPTKVTTPYSGATAGANDTTTDPTFTSATTGDFSVGTNMKALSYPGIFPGGLSTGYLDIGAVQRIEPSGGGTGGGAWAY